MAGGPTHRTPGRSCWTDSHQISGRKLPPGSATSIGDGRYVVRSYRDGLNAFDAASNRRPREDAPPPVRRNLVVASVNVFNFFTTLDDGNVTATGSKPYGADTRAEFDRQFPKLVRALVAADTDIVVRRRTLCTAMASDLLFR